MWEAPSKGLGSWAEGKQAEHWRPLLLPDYRCHLVFPSTMGFFLSNHESKSTLLFSGPFCLALSPQSKQEVITVLSLKIQSHFGNFLSTNTGPNFGAFRIWGFNIGGKFYANKSQIQEVLTSEMSSYNYFR